MSKVVPEGWSLSKINDTCDVFDSMRIPLNAQERALRKGHYPYYGANGVQGYIDDYMFDGEYVLLAEDGGYFEQWSSRPISYLVSGKFWVNNHAHILQAKADHETKYVHYSLVHKNILKHINGGTRSKLNQSDMRDIEYLTPPLPEQQKIATILSSVDNVIEKTRAQIDKLKDLKTGMMQELLTQGIGHTEFKDSPVGHVPVSWKVRPIGELLEFKNGLNKGKEYFGRGNPIVNFMDVFQNHGISIANLEGKVELTESEQQRFEVKQGDVFFTRTSEIPSEIGMSAVFLDQVDNVSFSGFTLRGRPVTEDLEMQFCKYCFSSDYVRTQIVSSCSYTTRALTNGSLLSQCLVAIPPKDEQLKITLAIDSVDDAVKTKQQGLSSLENTKKALMQVLLTGKVRVTPDESAVI